MIKSTDIDNLAIELVFGSPNQDSTETKWALLRKSWTQKLNRLAQVGRQFGTGEGHQVGKPILGNQ